MNEAHDDGGVDHVTEAAVQIEELQRQMSDACDEIMSLLRDLPEEYKRLIEPSRSYWFAHIKSALGTGSYPTHALTLQDVIDELYGYEDEPVEY